MSHPTVGYAGMTHLGLCSAIGGASKGFDMVCFDADAALVERLNAGRLPVVEPELDDMLRDNRGRISFTADAAGLRTCDLVYVAPDVPTDDAGASDLSGLDKLLELVLANTRPDAVVVVLSQVSPGFTRARQRPGRLLCYQVETLVFGRAVERVTLPERFIVGVAEPSEPLPAAFETFLKAFGCPILPMRFESAELTKIAINCCLVASVSTANTLAEICENIGADWSEIVPALKLDRRIGQYSYLAPGLGIAGGNLERDLATIVRLGDQHGTDVGVVRAWQHNSRYRRDWVLRTLRSKVLDGTPDATLAVLGLAYKENTHSTKNSPSLALLAAIPQIRVQAFDPVVAPKPEWHPRLTGKADALAACDGADAVIIVTPWPQFKELAPADIAKRMRGKIVIDPYKCLDASACRGAGLDHISLGVSTL